MDLTNIKQWQYISEESFDILQETSSENYSDPYFTIEQWQYDYLDYKNDILHKIILKDYDEDWDTINHIEIIIIEKQWDDSNQKYFVDYID